MKSSLSSVNFLTLFGGVFRAGTPTLAGRSLDHFIAPLMGCDFSSTISLKQLLPSGLCLLLKFCKLQSIIKAEERAWWWTLLLLRFIWRCSQREHFCHLSATLPKLSCFSLPFSNPLCAHNLWIDVICLCRGGWFFHLLLNPGSGLPFACLPPHCSAKG